MKKRVTVFVLMSLILLLSTSFVWSAKVKAASIENLNDSFMLIDDDGVTVEAFRIVNEETIDWRVDFRLKDDNYKKYQKYKVKIDTVNEIEVSQNEQWVQEEEWYLEKDFSNSLNRSFGISVKGDEKVAISIQRDDVTLEENGNPIVIENNLSEEFEGPYILEDTYLQMEDQAVSKEVSSASYSSPSIYKDQEENREYDILPYTDPFNYGEVETYGGIASVPGTYTYRENNQPQLNHEETTRNFDYSETYSDIPPTLNIIGNNQNFLNGYHRYQSLNQSESIKANVLTKKIVSPTLNPNQFDVSLDIIGGTSEIRTPIDIVFVIDKSGSMAFDIYGNNVGVNNYNSRWSILKRGLNKFVTELLTEDNDIRMGIVTFGSDSTSTVWAEQADYGNGSRFTKEPAVLLNNSTITTNPATSGTPTYLGVELAAKTLTENARPESKKYIVTLTDGVSTFYPRANRGIRDATVTNQTGKTVYKLSSASFLGNGTESSLNIINSYNGLLSHLSNYAYNSNVYPGIDEATYYALALGASGTYIDRTLAAIGLDGQYNAASEDSLEESLQMIQRLIKGYEDLFVEGTLIDPMSEFVNFQGEVTDIKFDALSLVYNDSSNLLNIINENASNFPQYAQNIKEKAELLDGKIRLTDMNLGGSPTQRNGIRLTYRVELKEEYRDGKFYPTNGPTYAESSSFHETVGFAIPSVRVETFDLSVAKEWLDDENKWQTRQDIVLYLESKIDEENWERVPGKEFSISKDATGEELEKVFTKLPKKNVQGKKISYRIVEESQGESRVFGYKTPNYSPSEITGETSKPHIVVKNELLKTDVQFEKVNANNTPLEGAVFTIRKKDELEVLQTQTSNPNINFSQLPIGSYVITETKAPEGYQIIDPFEIKIQPSKTNSEELIVTFPNEMVVGDGVIKVTNQLNDFILQVTKVDSYQYPLELVEFELTNEDTQEKITLIPDPEKGHIFISTGLAPGTYTLEETKTPSGFVGLEQPLSIVIDQDGKVRIDGKEDVANVVLGEKNTIELTVVNIAKGQLPSTGGEGKTKYLTMATVMASLFLVLGSYSIYRNRKGTK